MADRRRKERSRRILDILAAWETSVDEYDTQAEEEVSSRTRVAVITKWVPQSFKQAATLASVEAGNEWPRFKEQFKAHLTQ